MIIGVLSQKGGVGKTTIAVNAAATLATRGRRVLLVDADPQGSSLAWSSARDRDPLFPVVGMAKPSLHRDLPEIGKDYDVVVIDGAPRVNELGRSRDRRRVAGQRTRPVRHFGQRHHSDPGAALALRRLG